MRIVMMGTGLFAEPTFEALLDEFPGDVVGLVTQPEREAGRTGGATRQTGKGMANIARAAGLVIAQPGNVNTPDGLLALRSFNPDLVVVAAYGQILKPDVIATPPLGMINVHASLLPKYRGAAPVAHAILNGETRTGVTILRVVPGLDAGDMLLQEAIDIQPDETAGELEARLAPLGARLAVQVVAQMQRGPVAGVTQDTSVAKQFRAPKLKKEDGLIDWSKSSDFIARQVRAMQPWPTAYTFLHRLGKEPMRTIIYRTGETAGKGHYDAESPYGDLYQFDRSGFYVECGPKPSRGLIQILELQPAGKKRMTAEEFLRGYPITDNMRFGPERLP